MPDFRGFEMKGLKGEGHDRALKEGAEDGTDAYRTAEEVSYQCSGTEKHYADDTEGDRGYMALKTYEESIPGTAAESGLHVKILGVTQNDQSVQWIIACGIDKVNQGPRNRPVEKYHESFGERSGQDSCGTCCYAC